MSIELVATVATDAEDSRLHVLYRFFDAAGALLYVGMTSNPSVRFREHKASKEWWREVASITLEHAGSRHELWCREVEAIRSESPRYNHVSAAGAGGGPRLVDGVNGEMMASLTAVGEDLEASRRALADVTKEAVEGARGAAANGVPETVIARLLQVDRLTVRRWIGKDDRRKHQAD